MALAILCLSLPITLKLSTVVMLPAVHWCSDIGEDGFKCSLYLSPKVLDDPPYTHLHT